MLYALEEGAEFLDRPSSNARQQQTVRDGRSECRAFRASQSLGKEANCAIRTQVSYSLVVCDVYAGMQAAIMHGSTDRKRTKYASCAPPNIANHRRHHHHTVAIADSSRSTGIRLVFLPRAAPIWDKSEGFLPLGSPLSSCGTHFPSRFPCNLRSGLKCQIYNSKLKKHFPKTNEFFV